MSFWRFGFGAPSSIETLLNPTSPASVGGAGTSTPLHPAATLDKLLDEDDLLQEVKAQNLKLVDFLGRREVVARLLGYISGEVFDAEDADREEQRKIFNGAAGLAGEGDDGTVDDADSMLMSVLDPDESPSTERRRARNPYLCTEILASNLHTVTDTLFSGGDDLLGAFWDHVLDQAPEVVRKKTVQLSHWSRANGVLINTKQTEMLAFVKSRPRLVERLLLHFAASPVVDVTFRLVQCEELPSGEGTIEWLANEHLVPRLVAMLGPEYPPEMHATVTDFLRNVTTFCTSPHVHPLDPSIDQQPATPAAAPKGEAPAPPPTVHDDARLRFISNRLMRELTSEDTISLLMSFAIDSCPLPETDPTFFQPDPAVAAAAPLYPAPPTPEGVDEVLPNAASATSSLIHCLAVVADLIRRNNSDFVERQILEFYRREPTYPDRPPAVVDLGPLLSVVQTRLGALQSLIRYPRTLANGADTIATTFGTIEPLTLERYRIVELYGELLHCSNMGMLNRPDNKEPFYDDEGVLIGGQASVDVLATALEPPKDDVEEGVPGDGKKTFSALPSPELTPPNRSGVGSPTFASSNHAASIARAQALASSPILSGTSSPTGSEAMTETPSELDSETGVLTKEEAMQLQGIIAESRLAGDEDEKVVNLGPAVGLDEGKKKGKGRREDEGNSSRRPSVPVINYTIDSRGVNKRKAFPGDQLKACFRKHQVLETIIDLFFTHPWNSFLHSVVYDLVQQVLGARMDQGGNLMLARTLLVKAAVVEKIIQGDALNTEYASMKNKSRMGYMGHMIQMAEQVSRALASFPRRLAEPASRAGAIPQPGWDEFLSRSVKPMQESAGKPLGGGVPIVLPEAASEKGASSSSSSEGEDEDAAAGWGGLVGRKWERGMPGGGSEEAGSQRMRQAAVAGAAAGDGKSDEFARYLVSQIQGRGDRFSSDDSDSDDDTPAVGGVGGAEGHRGWAGSSGFGTKIGSGPTGEGKFGFDDRFDSDGRVHSPTRRRLSFDDDDGFGDDFGPFSDAAVASDPFADDHFAPPSPSKPSSAKTGKKKGPPPAVPPRKNLTVADWNADFKKTVDQGSSHDIDAAFGKVRLQEAVSKGAAGDEDEEEDDFGDFLSAPKSMHDSWTDFEVAKPDDFSPPTSPVGGFASRTNPLLAASPPRSSSSSSSSVASSRVVPAGTGSVNGRRRMRRRSSSASAASSEDEPLGPGVARGAKIRRDGKVEVEVDGRKVAVPSDDVALASFEAHGHGGGV